MAAAALDFLIGVLSFCWKVFYWGSGAAMMMAFTGCAFGGYYLFKERHPHDYWKVTASDGWLGAILLILLLAFVPFFNTICAWFIFKEHESVVYDTIKKIEVKHGFTETESA